MIRPTYINCPSCGKQISSDFERLKKKCPYCGHKFKGTGKKKNENISPHKNSTAITNKIQEYIDSGELVDALEYFLQELNNDPENKDLWDFLYDVLNNFFENQEYIDALMFTKEIGLKVDNQRADLWNFLGHCYFQIDECDLAIGCQDNAIKLDSLNDKYWADLGSTLVLQGLIYSNKNRFVEARKCFDDAIFYYNQAMSLGDEEDYIDDYRKLLEFRRNNS